MLSTEIGTMNHVGRRQLLLAAAALLVAPIVAQAQRATKPYRIGVLQTEESQSATSAKPARAWDTSKAATLSSRFGIPKGRSERLDDFALDLVRLKVDVIVAVNPAGVLSAKRATATIPIVMTNTL